MRRIVGIMETCRGYSAWEVVARAMLMAGCRFAAVDLFFPSVVPEGWIAPRFPRSPVAMTAFSPGGAFAP